MSKVIGLTGGIATGKSTVTAYLKEKGYTVIDTDMISHEALSDHSIFTKCLSKIFDVVDHGHVDRKKLGDIVFNDSAKRKQLEDLLHPYIKEETIKRIQACSDDMIFIDVPLLFEAHFDTLCDISVTVICDDDIQLERLMKRDHLSKEEALSRINAQMSLKDKIALSDYIITNNGSLEELYKQVEEILKKVE